LITQWRIDDLLPVKEALGDSTSYTLGVPPSATAPPLPEGLADVLDALPIGLYVVDRDLKVVAWNRLREKGRYGLSRQKAVGQPLRRVLGAAGFRATESVLAEVFRTGQPHVETVESGETLYDVRRLPVRRSRKTTHVLSWFEDITERRALEMRLIAADRFAFLGQLVSGVAHEISNPLAGIAGCAEALAELASQGGRAQSREARQFRNLIRAEVARCEQIVRFLLDSSRPSTQARADLAETVWLALRLLERHPAFARIRVRATVPRTLPAARIDADSLKQVVMALAVNASRAMPSGGTLGLRAARDGRTLVLDVTDTGATVPVAQRAAMFEPFATADAQRGAGLGLALARSLLRSRGGDLVYRPRKDGNAWHVVLRVASGKA
jgi:two-component system NtrC family sensor kinase